MVKVIVIVALFYAFGCGADRQRNKQVVVYDEASLKTFVWSTHAAHEAVAIKQLDSILVNASNDSTVLHQTIAFLETPFSNPNSSYRNQDLYSKLLQAQLQSKWYGDYEKKVAADGIKLLAQNNVGDSANDFTYTTPAGYKKTMYDIKADYVLLYFNNPECPACKEMKEALIKSEVIGLKVKSRTLKVLSMYTDTDEKLWLDHLNEYPADWIQGRDQNEYLYQNKVYDLRAIPTVYLFDKNKKVLLKDCLEVREIETKLTD